MICSPRWLLLAIWTPLKTKLSTGGCLTTSEFICTTEQCAGPEKKLEKAIDLAYTTLVQLCSHAHLIMCRVRNEKNRLSQIRLDGVSACTVLRPEYKTHKQKDANSFVFVIRIEIEGAEPR